MELGHGPPPASSTPHERLRLPTSCPAAVERCLDLGRLRLRVEVEHSDRILDACACAAGGEDHRVTAGGEDEWVVLDLGRLRRIWWEQGPTTSMGGGGPDPEGAVRGWEQGPMEP